MENLTNGQINVKVNGITDNDIDLEFLPLIYEIVKSIERDPAHDTTQKSRESQDAALKILEFEKKLIQAREQINRLPGIEHSQEEQLKQVDNLRKQLALKPLAQSYPIRRAAKFLVLIANKYKAITADPKNKEQLQKLGLEETLKKLSELKKKKF